MPVDFEATPLDDIKEIIATKPVLTDEEQAVAAKLRPQLLAMLKPEVQLDLEAAYAKKFKEQVDLLTQQSRDAVKSAITEWKDDQKPLTQDEINTLLSKDYIEFQFTIRIRETGKTAHFNLVELPQEIEEKFLKVLKHRFIPLMKGLVASEFKLDLNSEALEKLQSIIEAAPQVVDVLAELVAICLDPFSENKTHGEITEKWVKRNLNTFRILAVIQGQMEVQRYRDFFLNGFRLSKSLRQTR